MFFDLTCQYNVSTGTNDVICCILTYDSQHAVALLFEDDTKYYMTCYSLKTFELIWTHEIEGSFLKMNLIEQTDSGETFAVGY